MKKIVSIVLCLSLVLSLTVTAFAAEAAPGESRAVIGANLTDEQISTVYSLFDIERGSVTELSVTNAEERRYLEGLVDSSLIGTNSISCIYVEILPEGEGLQIATHNLTWCTQEMFVNALVTSGIDDAKIIVAAPFAVSGTAALTGIYKAYEDITGEKMDDAIKLISTQELVITGELADQIGSYNSIEIVNELKLILDETKNMTDEELAATIREIAEEYNVPLVDSQIDQLISLCRGFEKMNVDELKEKVEQVQETVKKIAEAQEKVSGIAQKIAEVTEKVKTIVETVTEFVNDLIARFKK